jgi:hypothetical protein
MPQEIPAKKRIVQFDESIKQSLKNFTAIHGQVVVHVNFISNDWQYSGIRIWPSTYLIAHESDHKSKILNVVNFNYILIINKTQFKDILNTILKFYEEQEEYLECKEITKLIKKYGKL